MALDFDPFLMSGTFSDSEASPIPGGPLAELADQPPSCAAAVRLGSRLRESLRLRCSALRTASKPAAAGGSPSKAGAVGSASPAAQEAAWQAEAVPPQEPQAGGPLPAVPQLADAWLLEDSCRDVCCELSSPPASAVAATEPAADAAGSPAGRASAAVEPVQEEGPEPQGTPAASGLNSQAERASPSACSSGLPTPPERPFTAVSQAPSSAARGEARLLQQVGGGHCQRRRAPMH